MCGARDYSDSGFLQFILDYLYASTQFTTLIQGGATGADALAKEWADANGVSCVSFPAQWRVNGKLDRSAGPKRNQRVIDEGKSDLVVAFPGGKGTADMVRRARKAHISVAEVE